MQIEYAIEISNDYCQHPERPPTPAQLGALKLGLEALKRLKFGRCHPSGWELNPLPGETRE